MTRILIRKFFCTVLSLALAACICLTTLLVTLMFTFTEGKYIEKQFASSKVTQELSQELCARLDEISVKNNISADVLRITITPYISSFQSFELKSVYRQRNYSISNSIDIDGICRDALAQYSLDSGKKLSSKATDSIVSEVITAVDDVCRIHNINDLSVFVSLLSGRRLTRLLEISIAAGVAIAAVIYFVNSRRRLAVLYYAQSLITSGEILAFTGLYFQLSGFSKRLCPTTVPAYNNAIAATSEVLCIALIIAGAALIILGVVAAVSNYRYYSARLKRLDAEQKLEQDLI